MNSTARFITLEGSEGAGKTTALKVIHDTLNDWGVSFIQTREPGGEKNAEAIRDLLLYSDHLDAKTELLLMFAARNEHVVKVIRPMLEKNIWVVSDRFVDASFAYQGLGRGLQWETIQYFESLVVGETQPDLTLYLDVDPETGLARAASRSEKDRIEKESLTFFNNIRAGYLKRMSENANRMKKIDANQSIESVTKQIQQVLNDQQKALLT
ncbi:dTMP kinase [Marinicella litoralis]|uniref:Thymidylate kinase n=1 Tax=Marinicella litoralis TaxID=644220 RepID=A0A4V3DGZ6_9GAMM|nr:dTMP kinase [Marinicella litoralis]TDR16301.1 thymidylate kinase [Marinicella litoralis]